jgi:translation initiation factor IF-3
LEYTRKPPRGPAIARVPANVRLIDEQGQPLGIMSFREAQDLAQEKGLDLIEVAPEANPPVCKIADYGRLRYKEQKKKAEMRKKQKIVLLKEIQLRPNIQEHDYQVKLTHGKEFLQERDRVKVSLQFRGREIAFAENGRKVLARFIEDLALLGKPEATPKMEGRRMIAILAPLKTAELETMGKDAVAPGGEKPSLESAKVEKPSSAVGADRVTPQGLEGEKANTLVTESSGTEPVVMGASMGDPSTPQTTQEKVAEVVGGAEPDALAQKDTAKASPARRTVKTEAVKTETLKTEAVKTAAGKTSSKAGTSNAAIPESKEHSEKNLESPHV